jgi:hypothetical protein
MHVRYQTSSLVAVVANKVAVYLETRRHEPCRLFSENAEPVNDRFQVRDQDSGNS